MIIRLLKKTTVFLMATALLLPVVTANAQSAFTDMETNHWAYEAVQLLVKAGTIKGYPDGSFQPNKTVTRAEFSKMIGGGTQSGRTFADVPEGHWVYEFAAKTDLIADESNNFNPDRPITRGETVYPMYAKAGKPEYDADKVPGHIAAQGGDEISWIYSTGVMVGNDGVNLRLGDTLTRAEAAALIIKADKAAAIGNYIGVDLKYIYGASNLFDTPYSETGKITYGEMSRAALRMAQNSFNVNYDLYYIGDVFEHEYAKDLFVMGNSDLGKDKISKNVIDKYVTVQDAVTCLKDGIKRRIRKSPDVKFIFSEGVKMTDEITCRELASLVAQCDDTYGIINGYYPGVDAYGASITEANKMVKSVGDLFDGHEKYTYIIEGLPAVVYEISGEVKQTPAQTTDFASEYAPMFTGKCETLKNLIKDEHGMDADVIYYPSLTYDNGSGFVTKLKVVITDAHGKTEDFKTMFGETGITCSTGNTVTVGSVIFVELTIKGYDLLS